MTRGLLRENASGVIVGCLTPVTAKVTDFTTADTSGNINTALVVPAGRFIRSAFLRNVDGTLAGSGALNVLVGGTSVLSSTVAAVTGNGVGEVFDSPEFAQEALPIQLQVGGSVTAGFVELTVEYS